MAIDVPTRTCELADAISMLARRLQEDVDRHRANPTLFLDIRELRRTLESLDRELRGAGSDPVSDAC